jgi:hypothetical protein
MPDLPDSGSRSPDDFALGLEAICGNRTVFWLPDGVLEVLVLKLRHSRSTYTKTVICGDKIKPDTRIRASASIVKSEKRKKRA